MSMCKIANPIVSIIVPVLNEEDTIADCLKSLLDQDYLKNNMEIIAVDNGSLDQSAAIIQKFPVQYIFEEKKGAGAARNAGAHQSRGELLAFIDADCIASKTWVSRLVASLEDGIHDAAGGDYLLRPEKSFLEEYLSFRNFYSQKEFFFGDYPFLPWLLTGNLVVRRNAFFKIGGFKESFLRGEDMDFSWLLIQSGAKLKYLPGHEVLQIQPRTLWNFYSKLFKDGEIMALLCHRYGQLCRKDQTGVRDCDLIEWFFSSLQKLKSRTSQIFLERNGLGFLRKIVYLFFAVTGHLAFLSGKGVNYVRHGLLRTSRKASHSDSILARRSSK